MPRLNFESSTGGKKQLQGGYNVSYGSKSGFYLHSGRRGAESPTIYINFKTAEGRNFFYNTYYQKGYNRGVNVLNKRYR